LVIYIIVSGMHGHKNIPPANPIFSGIIMSSPYSHISKIRVKVYADSARVTFGCQNVRISAVLRANAF